MSEPTQNRLRETADRLDEIMEVSSPWVHAKLTPMLRDAADVIEGLEHENAKLQKQAARLFDKTLELATKNAKLQELVEDMWLEGAFAPGACYVETDRLEERTRELGIEVDA